MGVVDENRQFLIIRLSGKAVRAGRIPVSQLLRLLSELNKIPNRVERVLLGEIDSVTGDAHQNISWRRLHS